MKRVALAGIVLAGAAGALTLAIAHASALPEGPVEPVWDREACAYCRMHVGEPAFAAQLQTKSGEVWFYDDPGCLLLHIDQVQPAVHAVWLRHLREPRWIKIRDAAFTVTPASPMGFGLGTVDQGTEGAIDLLQARARVHQRAGKAGGP